MESTPPSPFPPDIEAHVWRGLRKVSGQLKIGLLMRDAERTERWIARVIWLLVAEPSLKLDVVFRLQGAPEPVESSSALFRMVHQASARHFHPFEKVSLAGKPACCFVDVQFSAADGFPDESAAKIRKRDLDVLIWLDSEPLQGDCGELARFGVSSSPASQLRRPPYWRDVLDEQPMSVPFVEAHIAV